MVLHLPASHYSEGPEDTIGKLTCDYIKTSNLVFMTGIILSLYKKIARFQGMCLILNTTSLTRFAYTVYLAYFIIKLWDSI